MRANDPSSYEAHYSADLSTTPDGFSTVWSCACAAASVRDPKFHDLRGIAVTRLAVAGGSEVEIVTITGHPLKDAGSILDAHFLYRDGMLAESAIKKLERSLKAPS